MRSLPIKAKHERRQRMADVGTIKLPVRLDIAGLAVQLRELADKIDPPSMPADIPREPPTVTGAKPGEWLTIPWPPSGALREAVARAIANEGWTCTYHEPDPKCSDCHRAHQAAARAVLAAIGGEK